LNDGHVVQCFRSSIYSFVSRSCILLHRMQMNTLLNTYLISDGIRKKETSNDDDTKSDIELLRNRNTRERKRERRLLLHLFILSTETKR
jgi:hypothetical protein